MRAVLPGRPESRLQALATGVWASRRIAVSFADGERTCLPRLTTFPLQAYISGNAFAILSDHDTLLQTVYDDDQRPLEAIAFDEATGKIAVSTTTVVRIYKPIGQDEDALKVGSMATTRALPRE